jgi:hypothetical protein
MFMFSVMLLLIFALVSVITFPAEKLSFIKEVSAHLNSLPAEFWSRKWETS